MFAYLTSAQLGELEKAAVNTGLILKPRMLLFRDVRPSYVGFLPTNPAPLDQLRLDLIALNAVERLEDGSVPLARYLANAADEIRDLPDAKVFRQYENDINNRSAGLSALAPLTALSDLIVKKELIIHQDDTVSAAFVRGCAKSAASVAKLQVQRFDGGVRATVNGSPWLALGTGWLLKNDIIITNHHVINARRDGEAPASGDDFGLQGRSTAVLFDYDDEDVQPVPAATQGVEAFDAGLDYCVLRLAAPLPRSGLSIATSRVEITEEKYLPLNVIQHPNGKAKRFALRNNLAVDADGDLVRYYTDTDHGSSGSPVMDDGWRVVALHRGAAIRRASFQGKDTAYVNVGTQITSIVAHIKATAPALANELSL